MTEAATVLAKQPWIPVALLMCHTQTFTERLRAAAAEGSSGTGSRPEEKHWIIGCKP